MSTFFLYNPKAGVTTIKEKEDLAISVAKKFFIAESSKFQDITTLDTKAFNETLSDDDIVVLCGGDGTINYYINHVENIKGKLMYYPMGSGNDFTKDIGFNDKPIDLKEYITNLPKVVVNGKEYSFKNVWVAPTMNGKYYGGGMIPTPDQDRKSDKLSLLVFHGRPRIAMLAMFPDIFKGELGKHKKNATILTGKNISVKFSHPCALQIDGETILDVTEYRASK